jgi:hypothetical protein
MTTSLSSISPYQHALEGRSKRRQRPPGSTPLRLLLQKPARAAAALAITMAACGANAAVGDKATWLFNIPATGSSSIKGLFDLAATLVGTETANGVSFVLTPNPLSTGIADWPTRTFVEKLSVVYGGPTSAGLPTLFNANPALTLDMKVNDGTPPQLSLDAGYKTSYNVLSFDWGSHQFLGNETASWELNGSGVDLKDFLLPVMGEANNKPSPIFGVISLTAYDLATGSKANPTPSNWVAMQVPEPGSTALLMAGLSVLGFVGRRRRL